LKAFKEKIYLPVKEDSKNDILKIKLSAFKKKNSIDISFVDLHMHDIINNPDK